MVSFAILKWWRGSGSGDAEGVGARGEGGDFTIVQLDKNLCFPDSFF